MENQDRTAADIAKQLTEQDFRAIITGSEGIEIEYYLTAPADLKGEELDGYLQKQVQDFIGQNPVLAKFEGKLFVKIVKPDRQSRGLGISKKLGMSL